LVTANEKIVSLESTKEVEVKDEKPEMPEEYRVTLEELKKDNARLKRNALASQVESIIAKAENHRDVNGNGHSPVLLEIAKNAMLGEAIQIDETATIKLESAEPADIADYFRKVFVHLLETIPGQVRLESKTEGDNEKPLFDRGQAYTQDDYKSFWAERL
jgi:hypothetical protein